MAGLAHRAAGKCNALWVLAATAAAPNLADHTQGFGLTSCSQQGSTQSTHCLQYLCIAAACQIRLGDQQLDVSEHTSKAHIPCDKRFHGMSRYCPYLSVFVCSPAGDRGGVRRWCCCCCWPGCCCCCCGAPRLLSTFATLNPRLCPEPPNPPALPPPPPSPSFGGRRPAPPPAAAAAAAAAALRGCFLSSACRGRKKRRMLMAVVMVLVSYLYAAIYCTASCCSRARSYSYTCEHQQEHSAAQRSTAQHSAAQRSTAYWDLGTS
jgi:hypothetical protein